jgi:hypothetical protein
MCAQGGPPLETDDPGTPGDGNIELNLALEVERTSGGTGYDAPRMDFNYGAGDRVQLKLEVPWRVATALSEPTRTGFGNVTVGLKWRFAEWDSGQASISTYPQFTLAASRDAASKGLADSGSAVLLPIEIAWSMGSLSLAAELGYLREQDVSELTYGLVVATQALPPIELVSECHATGEIQFTGIGVLCGAGVRWELGPPISVLSALEMGVAGPAQSRNERRLYAGVQLRW